MSNKANVASVDVGDCVE